MYCSLIMIININIKGVDERPGCTNIAITALPVKRVQPEDSVYCEKILGLQPESLKISIEKATVRPRRQSKPPVTPARREGGFTVITIYTNYRQMSIK